MMLFSGANIRTLVDEVFWGLPYSVSIDFQKKFGVGFFPLYVLLFTKKALSAGNIYPRPGHFSHIFTIRGIHMPCMLATQTLADSWT